jgi:hypothetical protein
MIQELSVYIQGHTTILKILQLIKHVEDLRRYQDYSQPLTWIQG